MDGADVLGTWVDETASSEPVKVKLTTNEASQQFNNAWLAWTAAYNTQPVVTSTWAGGQAGPSTGTLWFTPTEWAAPAEPAAPPPAPADQPAKPKPAKLPAPKQVILGGQSVPAKTVRAAIAALTAATGAAVTRPLAAAGNPLAQLDLRALAATERAWHPAGKANLKATVLAALTRALDPTRRGPFTVGSDGYCQPVHDPLLGSVADPGARIAAIAKAVGAGRVVGRGHTAMPHTVAADWLRAWYAGRLAHCYALEAKYSAKPSPHHPGSPQHPGTHRVVWAPAVPGEVPAGVPIDGDWPSPHTHWPVEEVHNYLLAARMAHPEHLAWMSRRRWAVEHLRGDKAMVDMRSLRAATAAAAGHGPDSGPPTQQEVAAKPGYPELLADQIPISHWSTGALAAYAADHQLTLPADFDARVAAVAAHRDEAARRQAIEDAKLRFGYAADQPPLSGFHRKAVLVDQHGRRWLFKPAPDATKRFRPETEHAAHSLARAWGFRTADSHLITFDGMYGQVQAMHDAKANLLGYTGAAFATLTRAQLCAIAREHVLDWAIDNDDCHGENIVLLADGTAVGIDKGRAWRYFGGWPGLAGDARADTNCHLVYTALYAAIADGHLDRDSVDAMYRAALGQARRMQLLPDATLAEHIAAAVQNRPHYAPSSYQRPVWHAPTSADELIAAAIARTHSLAADFTELWTRIYARAGWAPPAAKVLGDNPQGHPIHTGLHSPELHAAVATTKSYGTPTFCAGTHWEDAHLLLWREKRPDGVFSVRGAGKLREPVRTALAAWCAARAGQPAAEPTLPGEADYHAALTAAAKTISFHRDDGEYNQAKLDLLAWAKTALTADRDRATAALADGDPDRDGVHAATAAMAATYLDYVARIERHRAERTKSREGDFPRYAWTPPAPPAPDPAQPRVERRPAARPAASQGAEPVLDDDGELPLSGHLLIDNTIAERGQPGDMYVITLPTGEEITYRCADTDTALSTDGLVEVTIADAADIAAGLTHLDAALTAAGVACEPADAVDLELFYWRHLAGILADRADSRPGAAPGYTPFWQAMAGVQDSQPRAGQLDGLRAAFAALFGPDTVEAVLATDAHLPRFMHMDLRAPTRPCGKPYWVRPDVPAARWRAKAMPTIAYRSGPVHVVATGVALATEARIRTLAIWKCGQSSLADMGRGSAAYLFARQNQETGGYTSVCLSPRVLTRTHTYAFDGDHYGAIADRAIYAAFDFDTMTGYTGSANELLIKDAVSLLDDIEILVFFNSRTRDKAVADLAGLGITAIRGVPVTVRFVVRGNAGQYAAALDAARGSYHQDW